MEENHRHLEGVINVSEGNCLVSTEGYGNAEVQQIERPELKPGADDRFSTVELASCRHQFGLRSSAS